MEKKKIEMELPEEQFAQMQLPATGTRQKELPQTGNPENTVMIQGKPIEMKPTQLRYQRDRTAGFYKMLEMYPLVDILGLEKEELGDGRTGDQAVLEWLLAVFDDVPGHTEYDNRRREERFRLIKESYNTLDTGTIERILEIFKRVNKITEKEEKRKNAFRGMRKG